LNDYPNPRIIDYGELERIVESMEINEERRKERKK